MRRLLILCCTAAALGFAPAAAATASEARVADGVLRVTGAPGESNDVLVAPAGDDLAVSDLGAAPETGPGCTQDGDVAVCAGADSVAVVLGDGDDAAGLDPGVFLPALVDGGAGSDSIGGGGGPGTLRGGAGDDLLSGGDVADTVDGGPGTDYIIGGGGADAILARDGEFDSVACGDGADTANVDSQDSVDADCEEASTSISPGPAPGGGSSPGGGPGGGGETATGAPGAAVPGGARKPRPRDYGWCSTHGSRTTLLCSVRLLRRHPNGALNVKLRNGGVVFAAGRGTIRAGIARLRLRTRIPVIGGSYALSVVVERGRRTPIRRTLGVSVLGGAPVR